MTRSTRGTGAVIAIRSGSRDRTAAVGRVGSSTFRRFVLGISSALVILSLVSWGTAAAASSNGFRPKPQPSDCPRNADGTWKYRCLDPDDYAQMTIIKINLDEEIAKLKAGNRHFGFGCAIGPGLGLVVDENLKAHVVPDIGAVCGMAVKF